MTKVKIECQRTVSYYKEIDVNDEQLKVLMEKADGNDVLMSQDPETFQMLDSMMDGDDQCEWGDFEIITVEKVEQTDAG